MKLDCKPNEDPTLSITSYTSKATPLYVRNIIINSGEYFLKEGCL